MTNSMLLWRTLEVHRNQEIRVASVSAKLRQSNRTDKRIELTMQLLHSCWTARSFEEQLFSLSVTITANTFLHRVTPGRAILSAL